MPRLLPKVKKMLVCPYCHKMLTKTEGACLCVPCDETFSQNQFGYFTFLKQVPNFNDYPPYEEYAARQDKSGKRQFDQYLAAFFDQQPFQTVLDVGCGMGVGVLELRKRSCEAYGVDLPLVSRFWAQRGYPQDAFFCADAAALPFPDDYFDIVYSMGVIEHIGTISGHCSLSDDYQVLRRNYAAELLRVAKPEGRILISCPNKSFPLDFQHGALDDHMPRNTINLTRQYLFNKTKANLHQTWGKYHLLSYREIGKLFNRPVEALPIKDFLGFSTISGKLARSLAKSYFNHLPGFLRKTWINPYVVALVRK